MNVRERERERESALLWLQFHAAARAASFLYFVVHSYAEIKWKVYF